jgi:hypothetical protein
MDIERIAELERINYLAMQPMAEVTPDLEQILRDDVILTSSAMFPAPDTTHACLLRATPENASALLDEVVAYFQAQDLTPTVFLSPACAPADMSERLLRRGFVRQDEAESWLVLPDIADFRVFPPSPKIHVRRIGKQEAETFATVFLTAFDMPVEFAPGLAQLIAPSVNLPGMVHYIAFVDEEPVGVCSLIIYQDVGIIGSAGIVPIRRGGKILNNLAFAVREEGRRHGVKTGLLQTTAGGMFERFLRISGFKRAFTRVCYMLL